MRAGMLGAVVACLGADRIGAQSYARIPDEPDCISCQVTIRQSVALASVGPGGLAAHPEAVVADSRGRYWVLDGLGLPRLFDSTGRFLQFVGSKGDRAGQIVAAVGAFPVAGDSVVVLDGEGTQALVFDADLHWGRSIGLSHPLFPGVPVRWPSQAVFNGLVGTGNAVGWPLHRVSMDRSAGVIQKSFGPDEGEVDPRRQMELTQALAVSRRGSFWSADVVRFRLTLWDSTGVALKMLERKPEWFAKPDRMWLGNPGTPPPPSITAIREDEDGLLWVYVRIPKATWRGAWPHIPLGVREVRSRDIRFERLFRTVVEVIDPVKMRVVARRFLDDWVVASLEHKRAVTYTVDHTGVPRLSVISVRLEGRDRGSH
jgi:hypothetical protein